MKTKNYNFGKKLTTLMIAALFSIVSFAATKENPTCSKDPVPAKTTVNNNSIEVKTEVLTGTLQNWMNNGSYWESDNQSEEVNSVLINELNQWMTKGSYWSEPEVKQAVKQNNLFSALKEFMANGTYWKSEK
jgi:hypothetical protein